MFISKAGQYLFFIVLLISKALFADSITTIPGAFNDVFVATHIACRSFPIDQALKGYYFYHIKGAHSFNNYLRIINEQASSNQRPLALEALVNNPGFSSALEACFPSDQKAKKAFVSNIYLVKEGGRKQRILIDSAIMMIGLIPMGRLAQFLAEVHASSPVILSAVQAAMLATPLYSIMDQLVQEGVKIFKNEDKPETQTITVPSLSYTSIQTTNQNFNSALKLNIETRALLLKKIAQSEKPNPVVVAQLAAVESLIREIQPSFKFEQNSN